MKKYDIIKHYFSDFRPLVCGFNALRNNMF